MLTLPSSALETFFVGGKIVGGSGFLALMEPRATGKRAKALPLVGRCKDGPTFGAGALSAFH